MSTNKLSSTLFGKLLSQLTPKELQQFAAYARFEISNTTKQKLLDYIVTCQLDKQDPTMEQLNAIVDSRLTRVVSEFKTILEGFIAGKQISKAKTGVWNTIKYMALITFLRKSSDLKLVKSICKKASESLQRTTKDSFDNRVVKWLFADQIYFHPDVKELVSDVSIMKNIDDVVTLGKQVYTLSQLQYLTAMMAENKLANIPLKVDIDMEVNRLNIDKNDDLKSYYYEFIQLYTTFERNQFLKLKKSILTKIGRYADSEQDLLFRHLINCCVQGIYNDNSLLASASEIYKVLFKNKTLLRSPSLIKIHILNFIDLACAPKIKRANSAKSFLQEHAGKLGRALRTQVVNLCKSKILMAEGKFEKAYNLLNKNNFVDTHIKILSKTTLLMACYDADEDEISTKLELFRCFLRDNLNNKENISTKRKEANQNFHKMLNKLVNPGRMQKHHLQSMLDNMENIAHDSWLQQKIDEW